MLTRLPGSKWWIETDDVTFEIIGTYNKTQITADILSIQNTLLLYPDATQDAKDVASLLNAVGNTDWTVAKKTRISALVNSMYQAYGSEPRVLEAAALLSKLEALIALRERLV